MTRMTGPDCVVMCNLKNTNTHTHTHTVQGICVETFSREHSFSTLRLNLVLTRGISPDFRGSVHLFIPP